MTVFFFFVSFDFVFLFVLFGPHWFGLFPFGFVCLFVCLFVHFRSICEGWF